MKYQTLHEDQVAPAQVVADDPCHFVHDVDRRAQTIDKDVELDDDRAIAVSKIPGHAHVPG